MNITPIPADELGRLAALKKYDILDTEPELAFESIVRLASYICQVPIAGISLIDEQRQWFKAIMGLDARETPRNGGFCAHAILQNEVMIVKDALKDARFLAHPLVTSAPNIRFYAGVPLITSQNHHLGTLCVIDRVPRELTKDQLCAVEALADNVMAHLELRLSQKNIRQQNEEIRTLSLAVEQSPSLVVITNLHGDIIYVNSRFIQMTGYTATEVIGRNFLMTICCMSDEDCQVVLRTISAGITWRKEMLSQLKNRNYYWTAVTIAPIRNEIGQITGFVALQEDISARKQAEELLIKSKEVAEAANRAKSAFLANMSHELRTPLNVVLGYAQILQNDPSLGELQQRGINTIRRSGEHLLTLINDVLDLAKVESGHLELFPSAFNLRYFFADISDMFRLRAAEKGIVFYYEVADSLPTEVNADEKRLRQVCLNLLSNAIKFTEHGEIQLNTCYRDGNLIVSVTDTGLGIPSAMHEQLFKPFVQIGDNKYKQQGTGLGLAISRNLVELMGGTIEFNSEVGKGSCFRICVPVSVVHTAIVSQESDCLATVVRARRTDGINKPFQVLIVDDIAENRNVLRGLLEPLGFDITEAEDGADAVDLTTQQTFDVILMDLVMPNMDGLTATRHILSGPNNNQRIIALTASAFEEDQITSQAIGCCDYIVKPVNRSALLRSLQSHLPLAWNYATLCQEPENIQTQNIPISEAQRETLLTMVQGGAINKLIHYLEQLLKTPNCPSQIRILLELANKFKLAEIRRFLEL